MEAEEGMGFTNAFEEEWEEKAREIRREWECQKCCKNARSAVVVAGMMTECQSFNDWLELEEMAEQSDPWRFRVFVILRSATLWSLPPSLRQPPPPPSDARANQGL